jgi:hypothetical protein
VGGWSRWFDSQEAALDSATWVAQAIPGVPRPATGLARMIRPGADNIEHNLRRFAERVARIAPSKHKDSIANVIEKVAEKG